VRRFTATLGAAALWLILASCSREPKVPQARVQGGDAGGLPRAQPADEHLNDAALKLVGDDAVASGLQLLVVLRHGHIVFERYAHGIDVRSEQDLGGFAQALLALASGIAVHDDVFPLPTRSGFDPVQLRDAIERGSHQSYPDYLSGHLWRRLNAAPAWIAHQPGAPAPADCCFHAQLLDWLRVGSLLVQDGYFEGKQLVPKGWVARMCQPIAADGMRGFGVVLPASAHGAEKFAADDVFFLRGPGHWRMWLIPSLQLAVLFGAEEADEGTSTPAWDETRLPNLVVRAVADPTTATDPASRLKGLVPGH
jgi:hypothetical protein